MSLHPVRTVRLAALVAALALASGLVACGSDGDPSAEVVREGEAPESTTTTEGTGDTEGPTTTTEGSDDPTTTTEGPDEPTTTEGGGGGDVSGDLRGALLTVDDLPAGHTQDGEDDTSDTTMDDDDPLCDGAPDVSFPTPVEQIERSFQTDDYSSLVGSFAARFDGDDAEEGLGFYRSELERCGGSADDDLAYEHRDLPGIGDEAVEISLYDPADPASGSALVYFARVDDVLVGVSVFASSTDIDGESLLALSVGRL
jgi:hypothetical protein